MRQVIFTPAASAELSEAQDWYEKEMAGLGQRFLQAAAEVITRISANPMNFPVIYRNVRRALLRRFPYALMFVIDLDGALTVIACFHSSPNPARCKEASVNLFDLRYSKKLSSQIGTHSPRRVYYSFKFRNTVI